MADSKTKSIKVLAIDGGGIRGIIPAVILSELQKRLGKELWQAFDLIAGTSTGGIIALGIGTACNSGRPYSPDELLNMYMQNGGAIFRKTWLTPVRELILPKYSPHTLERTLETFFKDTNFGSALTPLLISSYDLQSQLPFFFKSHRISASPEYNWKVVYLARATSAAPTFFPPYHLIKGAEDYALVDGGVFVNNPSMAAYAEARSLYPEASEVVVVSAGTGNRQDSIKFAAANKWGLIGWAKEIVPVLMDSVSEAVDYELKTMLGTNYCRLQVDDLQEASSEMDDVSPENLANLQAVAKRYVRSNSGYLDEVCAKLKEGRGSDMPGTGRV